MWVRAQIDYLQRPPNDFEKRKALKRLPQTLVGTYTRIFETIDSMYAPETTTLVKRILKWLVYGKSGFVETYKQPDELTLTYHIVIQAVCLENQSALPSSSTIPTLEQILCWMGCLVRYDKTNDTMDLSHFTVAEFLTVDPEEVRNSTARNYTVSLNDRTYILNTCLTFLMHNNFRPIKLSTMEEIESFLNRYPFFQYATFFCATTYGKICT